MKARKKGLDLAVVLGLLLGMGLSFLQGGDVFGGRTALAAEQSYDIPESLVEFAAKYPQAQDFVNGYPENKDKEYEMDVSDEVEEGEIPLFIQWDERWGYKTYGNDFMAVNGCGPTCLSMVVCGLTGETKWNPYEVAKFAEEKEYYVPEEGTSWELMKAGAKELGLGVEEGLVSEDYIREYLSESSPMICSVYPGDFTYSGHFIVLTGFDEEGNVLVNDPNSRTNSDKHWSMEELLPQIRNLWLYYV